jgi:hypothetical protein
VVPRSDGEYHSLPEAVGEAAVTVDRQTLASPTGLPGCFSTKRCVTASQPRG